MADHVWTLRSALEQALVLYEGEYGDAYEADDEQGSNFWAGHIATVRHVLAQPDEQVATIARLTAERDRYKRMSESPCSWCMGGELAPE